MCLKKPRYDYVFIKYANQIDKVLVRILMIIEIEKRDQLNNVINAEPTILLLVQLLYRMPKPDIETHLGCRMYYSSSIRYTCIEKDI